MVSAPRCSPGAWGLLTLLLALPGALGGCGSPPRFNYAEIRSRERSTYPVGFYVRYHCRPGYVLDSRKSPVFVCDENATWSGGADFCVGRLCEQLELKNGMVHSKDLRFGATADFSCNEGYRLIGPTSTQCLLAGNEVYWNKEVPLCEAIPCHRPPDIANGTHTGQSVEWFFFGSAVTYKCDQGFSLIGEASIHCTTKYNFNGEWSGPAPECKVGCQKPEVQNGSMVNALDEKMWYSVNETLPFKCSPGYQFSSHSYQPAIDTFKITCLADGSWTPLPKCKKSASGVCEMVPENREFRECGMSLEMVRTLLEVQKLYLEIEKLKQELKSQ